MSSHTQTHARTVFGGPCEFLLVGQDTSSEGASIVATPADKHDAHLGHMTLCLEYVVPGDGLNDSLAALGTAVALRRLLFSHTGKIIGVLRDDLIVCVGNVGGLNGKVCDCGITRPIGL